MRTIRANRLTTLSVAADGASVSTGIPDESRSASAFVLPSKRLQTLTMTMPKTASQSLRRTHGDQSRGIG